MASFVIDARVIDGIVALVAVEAITVVALRLLFGFGPALAPFLANLLAGAFLLLALRGALSGASTVTTGLCLLAALVAHLIDLSGRWRRS